MRVILSRKGFDSANGGCPSPILPDGTLLSLPIPSKKDSVKYSQLLYSGKSYHQIIQELQPRTRIKEHYTCHLDPDIVDQKFSGTWTPLFGQEGASQTHLLNNRVGVEDVFLFFGWFRQTEVRDGRLSYVSRAPDLHVIFGYLQIGDMYLDYNSLPSEYAYHPHAARMRENGNNCIYRATDRLSLNPEIHGAGVFKFHDELVLTKEGYSRSQWNLPDFFRDLNISYHTKTAFKENYFDSAKIGQEFVIEENRAVEQWAGGIIKKGIKQTECVPYS